MNTKTFQAACELLWGHHYRVPAAAELGCHLRTLMRYDAGERAVRTQIMAQLAAGQAPGGDRQDPAQAGGTMMVRTVVLLTIALGLLWGKAQAANDAVGPCRTGAYDLREWTCLIEALPEPMAQRMAEETRRECARSALMHESREWHARDAADCARMRAYIKQRWGY